MTDDSRIPPTRDDDHESGMPVRELETLEDEPSVNFVPLVRRRIYRRTAASQFVNFTWKVPAMLLRELLGMAADLLKGSKPSV